ncbi:MAG: hypothetical protein ACO3L1_00045 [Flavobacteriaceae bacterium]
MATIDYSPVSDLGLDAADGQLLSNGQNLALNCPNCVLRGEPKPDTKYRLHICVDRESRRFGFYHCFRCGFKGRPKERGGVNLSYLSLHRNRRNRASAKLQEDNAVIELPEDFALVREGMSAWDYLILRGLTSEDISYYGIGIGGGRVIFPDYDENGKLCYWVGRSYDGRLPRYKNCPSSQSARSSQIYNLGRFQREGCKVATLCEGPISAIAAGRSGIASYGKQLSEPQIRILQSLNLDKLYLALDPDAKRESLSIARKLSPYVGALYLVSLPVGEDPASLGREKFSMLRSSSNEYSLSSSVRFLTGTNSSLRV